jgi:hypothetical protein
MGYSRILNLIEHPEFADSIPNNVLVVTQIEGDDEINAWARKSLLNAAEKNNPIVFAAMKELKPMRSRMEKIELVA